MGVTHITNNAKFSINQFNFGLSDLYYNNYLEETAVLIFLLIA